MKNQDKLRNILIELTEALGFDHTRKSNEAFQKAYKEINDLLIKAGAKGVDVGIELKSGTPNSDLNYFYENK